MKNNTRQTGRLGEDEACKFLRGKGHSILARNWRSGHLEVDIVSMTGNTIHIVEVKARRTPSSAEPLANFTISKQRRLTRAAAAFLRSGLMRSITCEPEICFDLITITIKENSRRIDYYPQAFIPIYV